MSRLDTLYAWTAAAVITVCLVSVVFGLMSSRPRRIPAPVTGLAVLWTLALCVIIAIAVAAGVPDSGRPYGREWPILVGGLAFLSVALSHALSYILGLSVGRSRGEQESRRANRGQ